MVATVATVEHAVFCFGVLASHLGINEDELDIYDKTHAVSAATFFSGGKCAPFVTWNLEDPETQTLSLRGCIGTFRPSPMRDALRKFAIASAVEDPRFSPITPSEFSQLQCDVSLLHSFESASDLHDWEVGVHGVTLSGPRNPRYPSGASFSATLLPNVIAENNWGKDTTLRVLLRKAGVLRTRGYDEGASVEAQEEQDANLLLAGAQLTRYQSSKITATYGQYREWLTNNMRCGQESGSPPANSK